MPELNVSIDGSGATSGAKRVNSALDTITSKSKSLISTAINPLTAAVAAIGGYQAISGLVSAGDKYTSMAAQLEYMTGSSQSAEEAQSALYEMSQKTGTAMTANAEALVRLTGASDLMGTTTQENIDIIGGINALMLQTGTSTEAAKTAMIQMTQALGSGVLQGDEFRSIMEASPALMRKFAEAMGVGVGELKKMASEGKLTTEVMTGALKNLAAESQGSFDELPKTAEAGWQRVVNAFEKAWDAINDETGIMGFIYEALIDLAGWIEENSPAFTVWVENLVNSLRENWPLIRDAISSTWEMIKGLWEKITTALPSMETFFRNFAFAVDGVTQAIKFLITSLEWIFARWDQFQKIAAYTPGAAVARAAGTLAGGGSIGDAVGNAFDADGSNLGSSMDSGSAGSAGASPPTGNVVNVNVNQAVSRSDVVNIANEMTRVEGRK